MELILDVLRVALVAQVATSAGVLQVAQQRFGEVLGVLATVFLQLNVDLSVRTDVGNVTLATVAGVEIAEYLLIIDKTCVFVLYDTLESKVRLLPD